MRISDWSSDVCSSDLDHVEHEQSLHRIIGETLAPLDEGEIAEPLGVAEEGAVGWMLDGVDIDFGRRLGHGHRLFLPRCSALGDANVSDETFQRQSTSGGGDETIAFGGLRSEEHTSELKSLMRISYAD